MGRDAGPQSAGGVEHPRPRRRSWGYWTEAKLGLLERYLNAFTTATKHKSPRERIYLDAFAGEGRGVSRTTGGEFESSTRIALNVDDPPFSRLRFFELGRKANRLAAELAADFPERDFRVVAGDCNETIPQVLADLRAEDLAWAPTFAFLDPDGMELHWNTIATLAAHKRDSRYKVELWVLFNTPGLMRVLTKNRTKLHPRQRRLATKLLGNDRWSAIQDLRIDNEIDPADAREEFVNLFRWQLESDLLYRWTHTLEIKNMRGQPLYHMIFATDNEAGNKIMADLYNDAANRLPAMRRDAIDRISRQLSFGFTDLTQEPVEVYKYEPPWEPPS